MYTINDEIEINLRHVERIERNTHFPHLIFELVSGKSVVKEFETNELRDTAYTAVSGQIDGAWV